MFMRPMPPGWRYWLDDSTETVELRLSPGNLAPSGKSWLYDAVTKSASTYAAFLDEAEAAGLTTADRIRREVGITQAQPGATPAGDK